MGQVPHIDNTFGALLLSTVVGAALYGVSCAQAFYYFHHYSKKDGRGTKTVVIATLISDTVDQVVITHTVYTYLVTYYFQPEKLANLIWSPVVAVLFSGITALIVKTFYAVRIWKFSQGNVIVTAILSILIAAEFVCTVVYCAKTGNMTTFVEVATFDWLAITMDALAAAGDVFITAVYCTLLHRTRSNLRRSNTMINLLIMISVQTGMLTALCVTCAFVLLIAIPGNLIYAFFYFLVCRLYCNSLLATLNVRNSIRERGHGSLGISLYPIDASHLSATDNPKVDGLARGIDVKVEIETHGHIASAKSHGGDGSSRTVQSASRINNSWMGESEPELESGRP